MKNINGTTKLCGLIGNPVAHTLSPLIHNTLANELDHNLVYLPFLVENNDLRNAISGLEAVNALGCNVTVPFKSDVMPFLNEIEEKAEKIGAVNTIIFGKNGTKGYNTDVTGLLRAMKSDQVFLKDKDIIILGAGGAARCAAFLACYEQASSVTILNRTLEKAQHVAQEMNQTFGQNFVKVETLENYQKLPKKRYIAIQASSVGLYPNGEEALILETAFYDQLEVAYDLIYKPANTKFMQLAKDSGAKAFNGLKMLLYQGIEAYELWNDVTVSEEIAGNLYAQMKKELGIYE